MSSMPRLLLRISVAGLAFVLLVMAAVLVDFRWSRGAAERAIVHTLSSPETNADGLAYHVTCSSKVDIAAPAVACEASQLATPDLVDAVSCFDARLLHRDVPDDRIVRLVVDPHAE